VLLLDLNQMKNLKINFEGVNQLSTGNTKKIRKILRFFFINIENIYFLPCKYILDPGHCQSMEEILFLFETIDHSLFGILNKIINQVC
jgi:hypothetical protein